MYGYYLQIMFGFVLSKYQELTYDVYVYPPEAIVIAWIIACISISMIPIVAIIVFVRALMREKDFVRVSKQSNLQVTQHAAQCSYWSLLFFQNELMIEIYSNSLVRAIGIILHMKFSQNTN